MYGVDVDSFNVYVKSFGAKLGNPVWKRTGDQGDIWRHATVSITSQTQFQVSRVKISSLVKVCVSKVCVNKFLCAKFV